MERPAEATVLKAIRNVASSIRAFFKAGRNPSKSTLMTHAQIKTEIEKLASRIGALNAESLPTHGYSEQSGRPHIEIDEEGYHYVVAERGTEDSRVTTQRVDELLYMVFEHVTLTLAFDYELEHSIEGQDCRRMGFQKQIELLSALSTEWAGRCGQEHSQILQEHPFDDDKWR